MKIGVKSQTLEVSEPIFLPESTRNTSLSPKTPPCQCAQLKTTVNRYRDIEAADQPLGGAIDVSTNVLEGDSSSMGGDAQLDMHPRGSIKIYIPVHI